MKNKIFLFSGVGYGGAHNLMVDILKLLSGRGYDVNLIVVLPLSEENNFLLNNLKNIIKKEKVSLYWVKECSFGGPIGFCFTLFNLLLIHKKVAKYINSQQPKALIATHCRYTQSPFLLRFLNKIPTLFLFCEPKREYYEKTSFYHNSIKRKIFRVFTLPLKYLDKSNLRTITRCKSFKIITISKYSKKILKKIYNLDGKIIHPGVDSKKFFPVLRKGKENKFSEYFLSVGAFNFHKGFDFLIKTISFLPKNKKNLVLVGNGGYDLGFFKKLAKELKVKVKFKSFVSEKELVKIYQNAFLFLYSPRKEPFGISIFEAMSCGIPVLAINGGGYSEIFRRREKSIFLCDRNFKNFSKRIEELCSNKEKYIYQKKLVRAIAQRVDWSSAILKIERAINNFEK